MLTVCWSPKGGSGTSVVTIGLALTLTSRDESAQTLIVDLAGDIPSILGVDEPRIGISNWITDPSTFDLDHLQFEFRTDLSILPRGNTSLPDRRSGAWSRLVAELDGLSRLGWTVIVDAGLGPIPVELESVATRTYVVVRPCYLGIRRARLIEHSSTAVIVVAEPQRALTSVDIGKVLELPIAAIVPYSPDVARRVDAGVIGSRPSPELVDALSSLVDGWCVP